MGVWSGTNICIVRSCQHVYDAKSIYRMQENDIQAEQEQRSSSNEVNMMLRIKKNKLLRRVCVASEQAKPQRKLKGRECFEVCSSRCT